VIDPAAESAAPDLDVEPPQIITVDVEATIRLEAAWQIRNDQFQTIFRHCICRPFPKSEVTRVFWQATNMPFEASFFSRTSLFGLREWAKPLVLGKVDSLHATQIANDAAT